MSVLEDVLEEEYERSMRLVQAMEAELAELPKGSVRTRVVGRHEYYYLNYRDGDKVRSDYIPASEVEAMHAKVARRRELKKALAEQKRLQKQLVQALGRRPDAN